MTIHGTERKKKMEQQSEQKQSKSLKALAVVAGNWRFYQALYFTYIFPEYQWDIVILRYGEDLSIVNKIEEYSRMSQRFCNIYTAITPSRYSNFKTLIVEAIKMCGYYLVGKRKTYCRKNIEKYIGSFKYDLLCMACAQAVFEGAVINFSDEIPTIMMEEGMAEYIETVFLGSYLKKFAFGILKKMQYINLIADNDFLLYKNCVKFVRFPQKIKKNYFKQVKQLFDFPNNRVSEEFMNKINQIYQLGDEEYHLIIYTSSLWQYDMEGFYPKLERYIEENYEKQSILLKRHPRDIYPYQLENILVTESYCTVPGEIVIRRWQNAVHLFTFPSTILLEAFSMKTTCKIIYFKDCKNKSYQQNFWNLVKQFDFTEEQILYL